MTKSIKKVLVGDQSRTGGEGVGAIAGVCVVVEVVVAIVVAEAALGITASHGEVIRIDAAAVRGGAEVCVAVRLCHFATVAVVCLGKKCNGEIRSSYWVGRISDNGCAERTVGGQDTIRGTLRQHPEENSAGIE